MLFLFSPPIVAKFWMKNTLIPLDIGFIDSDGELKKTATMAVEKNPRKPKKIFSSDKAAMAAIEFAPKTFKKQQLGQKLCVGAIEKSP